MSSRFSWVPLIAIFSVLAGSQGQMGTAPNGPVELKTASDPKYQIGDIWEYQTRRGEERSRFIVVNVESSRNVGTIVHIGVDNLIWKTCEGEALTQRVPHMPFALRAIEASTTRRVASNSQLPNYKEGYEEWRQAFLKGHAGIYTIPVKDAISAAEETWRTGMGCGQAAH